MKKALAIAGILALSITPTASFANLARQTEDRQTETRQNEIAAGEQFATMYENGRSLIGTNWTTWTECYVNNHPDLISELPRWVWRGEISYTFPDGTDQIFFVGNLEQAGRLHYVLYGYVERRIPNCPARN